MVMHISCTFNGMNPFVKRGVGAGNSASAGTWLSPVLSEDEMLEVFWYQNDLK